MSKPHLELSAVGIEFATPTGSFRALDNVNLKINRQGNAEMTMAREQHHRDQQYIEQLMHANSNVDMTAKEVS